MKKYLFRLTVSVCAIMLTLGAFSASAATGIYDGTVAFSTVLGDVNDDGNVDIIDLVRLKKYTVDSSTEIFEEAADLDGNGEYNSADLTELRKMLLK